MLVSLCQRCVYEGEIQDSLYLNQIAKIFRSISMNNYLEQDKSISQIRLYGKVNLTIERKLQGIIATHL